MAESKVIVRRSERRKKTVTAFVENGAVVVVMPARLSRAEEQHWIEVMLARLRAKETGHVRGTDDALHERALELSRRYLAPALGGRVLRPASVTWVGNQRKRWGSTTPATGVIRLSDRLRRLPAWIGDYVLVHELAHLEHPDHTAAFWALLAHYPEAERARGFLEGYRHAQAHGTAEEDEDGRG